MSGANVVDRVRELAARSAADRRAEYERAVRDAAAGKDADDPEDVVALLAESGVGAETFARDVRFVARRLEMRGVADRRAEYERAGSAAQASIRQLDAEHKRAVEELTMKYRQSRGVLEATASAADRGAADAEAAHAELVAGCKDAAAHAAVRDAGWAVRAAEKRAAEADQRVRHARGRVAECERATERLRSAAVAAGSNWSADVRAAAVKRVEEAECRTAEARAAVEVVEGEARTAAAVGAATRRVAELTDALAAADGLGAAAGE